MTKVGVIGGGPSGCLFALLFHQYHPHHRIIIYQSPATDVMGEVNSQGEVKRSELALTLNSRGLEALRKAGVEVDDLEGVELNKTKWVFKDQAPVDRAYRTP